MDIKETFQNYITLLDTSVTQLYKNLGYINEKLEWYYLNNVKPFNQPKNVKNIIIIDENENILKLEIEISMPDVGMTAKVIRCFNKEIFYNGNIDSIITHLLENEKILKSTFELWMPF